MYNYGTVISDENSNDNYRPYSTVLNQKIALTLMIDLKDGERVFFPYSHFHPTKLTKQKENYFTLNLTGGGLNLIIHLKNFDKNELNEFSQALAKHELEQVFEYQDDPMGMTEPIISKVEIY